MALSEAGFLDIMLESVRWRRQIAVCSPVQTAQTPALPILRNIRVTVLRTVNRQVVVSSSPLSFGYSRVHGRLPKLRLSKCQTAKREGAVKLAKERAPPEDNQSFIPHILCKCALYQAMFNIMICICDSATGVTPGDAMSCGIYVPVPSAGVSFIGRHTDASSVEVESI
ncbi:hypothetical protein CBL_04230 [Carabus blaptoides fortunei]